MEIQLTKFKVTVKDEMSWGDSEQIQAVIMSSIKIDTEARAKIERAAEKGQAMDLSALQMNGTAILDSKVKAAELLVTKITETGTEKEVPFSREWMFSLSRTDGVKLMAAIDEIRGKNGDQAAIEGK